MPGSAAGWEPAQYERFAKERARPFFDLLAMVEPCPGGAVVDLGCGTGELTAELHRHTTAATTTGIDSAEAMLERATPRAGGGLSFVLGDIASFDASGAYDVVFANAALQWVPDHPSLLRRLRDAIRPGGQLAVQVPANAEHPSHRLVAEVAAEEQFRSGLAGVAVDAGARNVLEPERYAEHLHDLGFADQHVRLQVYGAVLPATRDVVEWTKGTTLVPVRRALTPEGYEAFVERYTERLEAELGDRRPYFYAFRRILFRARLPAPA